MRKNRKAIILIILAFVSFFLATIEGYIYFGKYEQDNNSYTKNRRPLRVAYFIKSIY